MSWAGGAVDNALYPVLMMDYFLMATGAQPAPIVTWLCKAFLATLLTGVNLAGLEIVGTAAIVVSVLVLVPFALLLIIGVDEMKPENWGGTPDPIDHSALIHNALWNFNGFDGISTLAGAVKDPKQTIPKGMFISTIAIMLNYLIPVMTTAALDSNWSDYKIGHYASLAGKTAGEWFNAVLFASATLSGVGMYLSELASDSYNLMAMGENGLVPRIFGSKTLVNETPWVAILSSYVVVMVLISVPFGKILQIDNWLYAAALLLEYAAFIQLRRTKPYMSRPFTVPGGFYGACTIVAIPSIIGVYAMATCELVVQLSALGVILFGTIAYYVMEQAKAKNWLRFNSYKCSADRADQEEPDTDP